MFIYLYLWYIYLNWEILNCSFACFCFNCFFLVFQSYKSGGHSHYVTRHRDREFEPYHGHSYTFPHMVPALVPVNGLHIYFNKLQICSNKSWQLSNHMYHYWNFQSSRPNDIPTGVTLNFNPDKTDPMDQFSFEMCRGHLPM